MQAVQYFGANIYACMCVSVRVCVYKHKHTHTHTRRRESSGTRGAVRDFGAWAWCAGAKHVGDGQGQHGSRHHGG
jgi:hypothetical protein